MYSLQKNKELANSPKVQKILKDTSDIKQVSNVIVTKNKVVLGGDESRSNETEVGKTSIDKPTSVTDGNCRLIDNSERCRNTESHISKDNSNEAAKHKTTNEKDGCKDFTSTAISDKCTTIAIDSVTKKSNLNVVACEKENTNCTATNTNVSSIITVTSSDTSTTESIVTIETGVTQASVANKNDIHVGHLDSADIAGIDSIMDELGMSDSD